MGLNYLLVLLLLILNESNLNIINMTNNSSEIPSNAHFLIEILNIYRMISIIQITEKCINQEL